MCKCYSQDVIVNTSADSIRVKVLEISPTEVKYKKADNQTGPTYSILKSDVYMILYENGSKEVFNQIEPRQFEGEMGQVYFIRKNGYSGSGVTFNMAIDDSPICKLKSNRYSVHYVTPGVHKISLTGNKFTVSEPISIKVVRGRITYIELTTKTHFADFTILIEKISETLAKPLLMELKENKKCQ